MPVLDIRGTHGSGKSWLVRQLLDRFHGQDLFEDGDGPPARPIGYLLPDLGTAVLGRYTHACGGCDTIGRADEVCRRIRLLASAHRHVAFEGILVSHTFQRYNALALEMEARWQPYYFCFLDTPLEVCIERVQARRKARGADGPFNPKAHVGKDWQAVWNRVRGQCLEAGRRVLVLPWQDPLPPVLEILNA
jgi:hypothetical protein